jgi:hypothetical protein
MLWEALAGRTNGGAGRPCRSTEPARPSDRGGAAMSGLTRDEIVDLTGYPADRVLRRHPIDVAEGEE